MGRLVSVKFKFIDLEHEYITPAWNRVPYTVEHIFNMGFTRLSILEEMSIRLYDEIS